MASSWEGAFQSLVLIRGGSFEFCFVGYRRKGDALMVPDDCFENTSFAMAGIACQSLRKVCANTEVRARLSVALSKLPNEREV